MQPDILNGVTTDYYDQKNRNLLDRWQPMTNWLNARADAHLDSYGKSTSSRIARTIEAHDRMGRPFSGVNFASQDYLGLASHSAVLSAANRAADTYGVHSAGSAALMGLTHTTLELERRIANFLHTADATVFPTGWAAGFGTIRALVKPGDHIVLDVLSHACLQEAATLSTPNVHRFPHRSAEGVERRLKRIRNSEPDAGILVVTETLFSMDSDVPDLAVLQDLCRHYDATLFVDAAHDLGAIGPTGRGFLEMQQMLGGVDVVMGSFSKTFASNGGFAASSHPALKLALRYGSGPLTFSNALSPVQAATVLACFDVVEGSDGAQRRKRLMKNATSLRAALASNGFDVLGQPSAIVPVVLGDSARSRRMTAAALGEGAIVNLVEYPAVARNACRWRIQLMSEHRQEDLDALVRAASVARERVVEPSS
ncbi:MAG: aminotransferase class I/II-fold pyridoxal phosphate-dependent enzyme [Paracoccaceae bacterium]